MKKQLGIVVHRFPALSETFILNEICELISLGYDPLIICCARSDESDASMVTNVNCSVLYRTSSTRLCRLMRWLTFFYRKPLSTLQILAIALKCSKFSRNSLSITLNAVDTAIEHYQSIVDHDIRHLHGHFLHLPALSARLLATLVHKTFSLSAHARDIFVAELRLNTLCRRAVFVAVCSNQGRLELLRQLAIDTVGKVVLRHHGIDLQEYRNWKQVERVPRREARLLTVSRLVKKKGVDTILKALAIVQKRGISFSYCIVGTGGELAQLRNLACRLSLRNTHFLGAAMKPQINDFYRTSDLFILGSRVSKERDRDGIPNVILEAMASGLPVVATNCGGIPEVIEHRLTGLLVPPDDPLAMADAIVELLRDDKLQNGLATNARTEIEKHFDLHVNVLALCELFDPCLLH